MSAKIKIISGENVLEAELNDSRTAAGIKDILPIKAKANRWGKEIYFSIPYSTELENPTEVLEKGDLAFWPPGKAFCIFWGKTPASVKDEIRAASDVNIFGKITAGMEILENEGISSGDPVNIELIES